MDTTHANDPYPVINLTSVEKVHQLVDQLDFAAIAGMLGGSTFAALAQQLGPTLKAEIVAAIPANAEVLDQHIDNATLLLSTLKSDPVYEAIAVDVDHDELGDVHLQLGEE